MLRFSAGCFALTFLGLASVQGQTIYAPPGPNCSHGCVQMPAATWPYGYYQTMWTRGAYPPGFHGGCPGGVPMGEMMAPMPPAGMPTRQTEPLPMPSKEAAKDKEAAKEKEATKDKE